MQTIVEKEKYLKSLFVIIRHREPTQKEWDYMISKYDNINLGVDKVIDIDNVNQHLINFNNPHNVSPTQMDSIDYTLIFNNNLI